MINDDLKQEIEAKTNTTIIQASDEKAESDDLIITLSRPDGNPMAPNNEVLSLEDMKEKLSYHCNDGFCGNCQCKLLKGVVAQSNDIVAYVNEGNFLACKSKILSKHIEFEANQKFK